MGTRVRWAGLFVGAIAGAALRAGALALHVQGGLERSGTLGLYTALVGLVVGAVAGAVGRPLLGAAVGTALSLVFALMVVVPFAHLASILGATMPSWWEILVVGAVPGALGGLAERLAERRRRSAAAEAVPPAHGG